MIMETREGQKITGVYCGKGYCYCDTDGHRYGMAEWVGHLMEEGPLDVVRPIVREFAAQILLHKTPV
jgi:hypothetical protein